MVKLRKKVLHFIESEGVYGAERVILNLSKEMRGSAEFEPVVGCIVRSESDADDLFSLARELGVRAIKLSMSNARLLIDLLGVSAILRQEKIVLIHSHGYKPTVYGALLGALLKVPMIATCHSWPDPGKGPLKMKLMVWLQNYVLRWLPKVLAVSDTIRQCLIENGVDANRISVVPNGVDFASEHSNAHQRNVLRKELEIKEDDYCVLNIGRLTPVKAQWVVIEAAAILKKIGQPCRFLIVGEGAHRGHLQALIEERDVEDSVKLLGFRSDIHELLNVADLFVLPSLSEGMPMSLLEAANAKVPVAATAVGDIPKLLEHERSGLIVPQENPEALAERIIRLKNNSDFAQALADEAHTRVRALYSSQVMCQQYIEVYTEVLS